MKSDLNLGLNLIAKAGAVFTSVDSEATFKVNLKWTNKENQMRIKIIDDQSGK